MCLFYNKSWNIEKQVPEKECVRTNRKWMRDGNATKSSTLAISPERSGEDTNTNKHKI